MPPLTDAGLIRRATCGDAEAFDCLVLRHRGLVLRVARQTVGERELAEDAAQEALLEAYASLGSLREPERLEGWLATITRRVAGRLWRRRYAGEERVVAWAGGQARTETPERPAPPEGDLARRVREAIEELSLRHRQIMTLHYLQGLSVAEIGRELGLPAGTVKRILHEARAEVREEVGAMTPGSPVPPRKLVHWIDGWYDGRNPRNVFSILGWTLSQSICLAVNKQPRTLGQIAKEVGAHEAYVADMMQWLVGEEIVVVEDGKYRANFVALAAADWEALMHDTRRLSRRAVRLLRPQIAELAAAYATAPLAEAHPWEDVIWPVLAVFTCNMAVNRLLTGEIPPAPRRPSGAEYWLSGREEVHEGRPLWTMGFNSNLVRDRQDLGHGYFCTFGLRRDAVSVGDASGRLLGALDEGCRTAAQVAERTGEDRARVEELAAEWVTKGLLRRDGDSLRISFPVFHQADSDALIGAVTAVAQRLADGVLRAAMDGVVEELAARGYGHLREQLPLWRRQVRSLVCGEAVRILFEAGDLPAPPRPAPCPWAFFGWEYGVELARWDP